MKIKIHKDYRPVVAVCDKELIGKKFEEDEKILEVKEKFFNGDEFNEEKAIELLQEMKKEDATFNIVGDESIKTALKANIIKKQSIGKVQNIPFALVLI